MPFARSFLVLGLFVATSFSTAKASTLSGPEIKSTIAGSRVTLSTTYGAFPLSYGSNQTVTGDGAGTGLGKFFNPRETGKWWVRGDRLCQKFPTWYKGRTFCFALSKLSANKLKWVRDDGYSGTALIKR